MAPVNPGSYEFDPKSITELRQTLGFSQVNMAAALGIPPNTLSRWETGGTKPDAESLAGIYSLAMDKGITPRFFRRSNRTVMQRTRLIVNMDFQNIGLKQDQVARFDSWIVDELDKRFPGTTYDLYKAFTHSRQAAAADELINLGWRVWEEDGDIDDELYSQAKSDCLQDPEATIYVLATKDGDFSDLATELIEEGVRVYLIAPQLPSNDLLNAVGNRNLIRYPWNF